MISTNGVGSSQAGDLTLDAKTLSLNGRGSIQTVSASAKFYSDITTDLIQQLTLTVDPVVAAFFAAGLQSIANLANVISSDVSQGNSANITIRVDQETILNGGGIATKSIGTSNGGNLLLTTGDLILTNDSRINSEGNGSGNAGNIGIIARDRIFSANSEIAATASQSDGGNIDLTAPNILFRDNSLLSTSVFSSKGGGGNITINARSFVATENSDILANAEDGTGGNISINSPAFLANLFSSGSATPVGRNPGSFDRFRTNARVDISADSASGQSGIVNVPNIDPGRGLVQLPLGLADRRQIDNPCSQGSSQQTRGLATRDEFVITGRGGIAKTPDDTRSVDALITPWATLSDTTPTLPVPSRSAQSTQPPTEATAVQQLADGRVSLVDPQAIALNLKRSCELNPIDEIKPQSPQKISLKTIN
jgi:large exoprotein involved in heme utilization and adhesion